MVKIKLIIRFLTITFVLGCSAAPVFAGVVVHFTPACSSPDEIIIAKVGSRKITLQDFIERSEYTIRAPYCRGNSNNDKNIILNTLIAEKILSLEAGSDNELHKNRKFTSFITGRKEQKMRDLLYYNEGIKKVKLASSEVETISAVAGRTYIIQYFNVSDRSAANTLMRNYTGKDSVFERMFSFLNNDGLLDSIPEREISWYSPEPDVIHKALFSGKLKKNDVIGPLNVNDSVNLFIKIKGWNDRLAISESDVKKRKLDITEKLTAEKADSIYDKFVLKIMGNKKLDFDVDVFNRLIHLLAPFYINRGKETEEDFLKLAYKNNVEVSAPLISSEYTEIKDLPLLGIQRRIWSVADLLNEIDKHPLGFRKAASKDSFAEQFRLAVVDLVRDRYLTDEAYERGYDKNDIVIQYGYTWLDASTALYQRDEFLKKVSNLEKDSVNIFEGYLNPHIRGLLKKYSENIEINVDEYNKIALTGIDMFTTQSGVPYPVYVPAFPQLTTYNRLDYGRKMKN